MIETGQSTTGRSRSARTDESRVRDAYARRTRDRLLYSWFDPGHLYLMQSRERRVLDLLRRASILPLSKHDILEVGCGQGTWLRDLVKWGAAPERLHGIELRPEGVAEARHLTAPGVNIACASAAALPQPDRSFDVVLQSMVFSSVLDPAVRLLIAGEMLRVLRPDGVILWYDFHVDNPSNPDVKGIRKKEIHALFPGCTIYLQRVTLVPPLARRVARQSWLAALLLESLPFLRTHYVGVIRRG